MKSEQRWQRHKNEGVEGVQTPGYPSYCSSHSLPFWDLRTLECGDLGISGSWDSVIFRVCSFILFQEGMAAAEGGRRLAPEEFLDPCWPGADFIPSSSTKSLVVCVCVLSRIRLFSDPMECSPPGSSVHGISLARILEWVAISFSTACILSQKNLVSLSHCVYTWLTIFLTVVRVQNV